MVILRVRTGVSVGVAVLEGMGAGVGEKRICVGVGACVGVSEGVIVGSGSLILITNSLVDQSAVKDEP